MLISSDEFQNKAASEIHLPLFLMDGPDLIASCNAEIELTADFNGYGPYAT